MKIKPFSLRSLVPLTLTAIISIAHAQTTAPALPDPASTTVQAMGWMQGFPPAPDKLITFDNPASNVYPRLRWTFSHIRELVPTANVWRGPGAPSSLQSAPMDLDNVRFKVMGTGEELTFAQSLERNYTDGIVVLHKGKIVYEKYMGALTPERPHLAMSVTKSFVGTLAALLASEGAIKPEAPVTDYVPEMKNTAYGDATVREVMDMTIGVKYSENYTDPKAEVWDYARAGGMMPQGKDYAGPKSFYEFLQNLQKEGEHDQAFAYKTANAEMLAWIVRRASGKSLAQLLSDRIWSRIGAEQDGYFMVDRIGTESGGGGLNITLRDLARFGEMMRNHGRAANGQQVLPKAVIEDIRRGGDPAKFAKAGFATLPGWSYRNMWWISNNADSAYAARGIHGQAIYIDPKAQMVIARFGSHPIAANGANDPISLPMYQALADALMKK